MEWNDLKKMTEVELKQALSGLRSQLEDKQMDYEMVQARLAEIQCPYEMGEKVQIIRNDGIREGYVEEIEPWNHTWRAFICCQGLAPTEKE